MLAVEGVLGGIPRVQLAAFSHGQEVAATGGHGTMEGEQQIMAQHDGSI